MEWVSAVSSTICWLGEKRKADVVGRSMLPQWEWLKKHLVCKYGFLIAYLLHDSPLISSSLFSIIIKDENVTKLMLVERCDRGECWLTFHSWFEKALLWLVGLSEIQAEKHVALFPLFPVWTQLRQNEWFPQLRCDKEALHWMDGGWPLLRRRETKALLTRDESEFVTRRRRKSIKLINWPPSTPNQRTRAFSSYMSESSEKWR